MQKFITVIGAREGLDRVAFHRHLLRGTAKMRAHVGTEGGDVEVETTASKTPAEAIAAINACERQA